jgi:hypothetical protein
LASASGGHPAWLLREVTDELVSDGAVRRGDGYLALQSHPLQLDGELARRAAALEDAVEAAGYKPPETGELEDPDLARDLVERGRLLELGDGSVTTPGMAGRCARLLAGEFGERGFRLGEMRDALGVTRKYALMWAELMDDLEKTVRRGDYRYLRSGD